LDSDVSDAFDVSNAVFHCTPVSNVSVAGIMHSALPAARHVHSHWSGAFNLYKFDLIEFSTFCYAIAITLRSEWRDSEERRSFDRWV